MSARSNPPTPKGWSLPSTDRERALTTRGTFLLHLRPVRLATSTIRWTHTFGLGGSALVLWLALASTGALMLLVYQPVPAAAWDSVRVLETEQRFGALVRGVHYWSANLLVVVVLLHVARVVLTGGYHAPRRVNWLVGCVLLALVLGAAFTGYLLPWDQRAYWAVTISTGMLGYVPLLGDALQQIVRGGAEIGEQTLLAFYTYHTTLIPLLTVLLMAYHFWRVRRAGGVVEPPPPPDASPDERARTLFFPDLLIRELAQALAVLAVVVVLGAFVGASIGVRADPGMSPNPAKAPWYFVGLQELLIHLHPVVAVLVVPLAVACGLIALPLLGGGGEQRGRWFLSERGRRCASASALLAVVVTVALVLIDDRVSAAAGRSDGLLVHGVVPLVVAAAALVGAWQWLRRGRLGLDRDEALQSIVVFLFVSFVVLTVVGAIFRGAGMSLGWPWGS